MSLETMIRRRNWARRALGLILLLGWGGECLSASPLRLVGSDLLGPGIVSAVKEFAEEREIEIKVDLQGSLRGRHELEGGRAEVALISASPGDAALSAEYSWDPLAYHVVFLWVSRELLLPQLSYDQIAEIFSSESTGARKRWRDFGAQGEGGSRLAMPGKGDEASGLSLGLLQHKLGRPMHHQFDPDELGEDAQDIQGDILIRAFPPLPDDDWETVAIALKQTGRAYQPTPINLRRGDYPLNWPLRLVFRRNDVESLYPLLRFLLSDEIAQKLREVGMVPLPEAVRRERIFDLERL